MYIKSYNSSGENVIINFNVADAELISVKDSKLVFQLKERDEKGNIQTKTITLVSQEEAEKAFNALFVTLGLSAPLNNVLDLTGVMIEPSGSVGYTIPEIAKKLKVDPRKMSIVYQSIGHKEPGEELPTKEEEKDEKELDEVE